MWLITQLKDDWLWRLPNRLDNMKFKGLSRPCYTILCLAYYTIKDLLIILSYCAYRYYKFIFYDFWQYILYNEEFKTACRETITLIKDLTEQTIFFTVYYAKTAKAKLETLLKHKK